jgi:UDP-N-acetylglucosamine:LPS N-acetylglucosamine transferase
LNEPVVFVEGSTNSSRRQIPPHIQYYSRIDAHELQPLLESASLVVCRSGYSSLMDLVLMKKPAVLIPTPGQTEQEYLARTLFREGIYYTSPQKGFSLLNALSFASSFPFNALEVSGGHEEFKPVIAEWLESL